MCRCFVSYKVLSPDFISADETYKRLKTLALNGDELFRMEISLKVDEMVKLLNKKMEESVKALPAKERTMMARSQHVEQFSPAPRAREVMLILQICS